MTPDDIQGPERDTSPAPGISGPAFSLRYHIDWRDALLWETLPVELRGLQYAVYIGFLVLGGMAYGIAGEHLPRWITDLPSILPLLVIVLISHALWSVYARLRQVYRAKRRLPRRILCIFEDWRDHIYLHSEVEEVSLSPDLCRRCVQTETHLFLEFPETLVILPLSAFDSPAQGRAFFATWERLVAEAAS